MKYRADVDGLRAFAVVPVVLFHAGLEIFSGGYTGVDVFFVISGYVITNHILDELEAGRFSIAGFYERRIRRLLPAAFAVAMVTTVIAAAIFMPTLLLAYSKSLLAMFTFSSNIFFWRSSGYFDSSSHLKPLLHTWSLAVEEQFYVFMPVAMAIAFKLLKRRWWIPFVPVVIASFALSVFLTTRGPSANFYLLPTRAWELLLGALLARATLPSRAPGWAGDVLAATGLLMLGVGTFCYSEATAFPGASALLPCVGAAVLILGGTSEGAFIPKLIGAAPLRFVGRISYSFYLVHWPLIVFFWYENLRAPRFWESIALFAVSFVLAVLSWRYFETPFRKPAGDARQSRTKAFSFALLGVAAFSILGLAGVASGGLASRFPPSGVSTSSHAEWLEGVCFLKESQSPSAWSFERCVRTQNGGELAMLWGDSFAAQYMPGLLANSKLINASIVQYTAAGCPPSLTMISYNKPNCHAFNEHAFDIIRDHQIHTVILSARWHRLSPKNRQGLDDTINRLHAMGVRTYVIGQSPEFSTDVQIIGFRKAAGGTAKAAAWSTSFDSTFNDGFRKSLKTAEFVDPMPAFCKDSLCSYRRDGQYLFSDFGHFSPFGSGYAVQSYFPRLVEGSQIDASSEPLHRGKHPS